nr:hypothetical protein [Tanacetum cinerariifolium]
MGDEHLDTISATESDEVIKSRVENLVPILSESEGILDTMCDVHFVNNPTPLEANDHFEIVINSNDDISSSDDDSLYNENIEYVEASTHDSELVSLEAAEIVIRKLKILRTIICSSSISPKSFLEENNTFHNSLPEFENFYFNLGEISSGSTTTHYDISLPDYKAFYFNDDHIKEISSGSTTTHSDISLSEYDSDFPNPGELIFILNSGIRENLSTTRVNLPVEDDYSPLLACVVWIFLAYLTDDDSLYNENIEYVEASTYDSELVSLEAAEIVILEVKEIEDDNLREKLLNVHLLIANIEALKDNLTPSSEFLTKSSSTSPKSFLEETNTFHNSLPEFENFCFNLGEISSGSTTTHYDISLPDYEAFYFNDDHIEEISSGSTTTHSDISLSEYDSFAFDLSND